MTTNYSMPQTLFVLGTSSVVNWPQEEGEIAQAWALWPEGAVAKVMLL